MSSDDFARQDYDKAPNVCCCGHLSQSHATGGKCEAYIHPDSECSCPGYDDMTDDQYRLWWLAQTLNQPEDDVREATEAGRGVFRVVSRDGIPTVCTRDVQVDRVNAEIKGGFVVKAYYG